MCIFFSLITIKHRNITNLKLFLRNSYTRICEKLMRPVLQPQTEKLSTEDIELPRDKLIETRKNKYRAKIREF